MKRIIPVMIAVILIVISVPCTAVFASEEDFVIDENGVLVDYKGNESEIVVPDGVTGIGEDVFFQKYGIISVHLPEGVTFIGRNAFFSSNIKEINFPKSLKTIDEQAFVGCDMETLIFPAGFEGFDVTAFDGCDKLTEINIDGDGIYFKSIDGVLFSADGTTIVKYPPAKEGTRYVLPDSVTVIADYAFSECNNITRIDIPDRITDIGEGAFTFCQHLVDITLPAGLTEIKEKTFYNCTNLTGVVIPDTVTDIGARAFFSCLKLGEMTFSDNITNIGEMAFYGSGVIMCCREGSYINHYANENYHSVKLLISEMKGDVNSDYSINLSDVTLILKHIAGWSTGMYTDNADVTGDGNINLADVSLILKYIAGWDVTLG